MSHLNFPPSNIPTYPHLLHWWKMKHLPSVQDQPHHLCSDLYHFSPVMGNCSSSYPTLERGMVYTHCGSLLTSDSLLNPNDLGFAKTTPQTILLWWRFQRSLYCQIQAPHSPIYATLLTTTAFPKHMTVLTAAAPLSLLVVFLFHTTVVTQGTMGWRGL